MVTGGYIEKANLDIELHSVAPGGETVQKTSAPLVSKAGKAFLDGVPMEDAGLVQAVQDARARGEDVQAIVGADKNATHGSVTHLLDVLKGAGVTKFAIQIEKEQ